ncbi:uncharacterized protein LOC119734628 isoform X4 [Patiria miniata]|uniref:Uncharacterized protein n=1 Tax=Patiria miniata TaxID=46514 RepID=A0A914AKJ7_PATMI|nr:uncharacterized protein LOC119734628 isoform X4 [Patiria miniata]
MKVETLTCLPGDFDCGHSVCIDGAWQCDYTTDCRGSVDQSNCARDRFVYIKETASARLVSPNYPSSYPDNRDRTWIIQAEEGRKIRISFSSFDTEYRHDYVQAGDGNVSAVNMFFEWSWTRPPPDLVSSGNSMWLKFRSDGSYRRRGFLLSALSVPVTETLNCSPFEFDCGHSVCISGAWQCDSILDCFDGGDERNCGEDDDIYLRSNETAEIILPTYPSNYPKNIDRTWLIETEENRRITVTFPDYVTVSGEYVFRAGDGNGTANTESVFLEWTRYSTPPPLLSAGSAMWLRFEPAGKGTLVFAFPLLIKSVPFSATLTCSLGEFDCGHSVCISGAWQCDTLSDCLDGRDELHCDEPRFIFIRENETTQLVSPGYPGNYPTNVDIVWILQTEEDRKIYITFQRFETQIHRDFLRAGDGNMTTNAFFEWDSYYNIPPDLLSNGNTMWLRFTSGSYYYARRGFSLTATSVPSRDTLKCSPGELDCGHSVCIRSAWQCDGYTDCLNRIDEQNCDADRAVYIGETETALLASARFPTYYYLSNRDTTWIIQTEEDRRIRLSFNSLFRTEYRYDVVRAGDGNSTSNNIFFEWSWVKVPPDIISNGNTMWLTFVTDGSTTFTGFSLHAVSVPSNETLTCLPDEFDCGHSVCIRGDWRCDYVADCLDGSDELNCGKINISDTESVLISSPRLSYTPRNFYMTLVITTKKDQNIIITFTSFQTVLEDGRFRAGDGSDNTNETGIFFSWSGNRPPPDLLSDGNTMWLSFETGKRSISQYFQLRANTVSPNESITCSSSEFHCGHSVCISASWLCDGVSDCVDGVDERTCETCVGRCFLDGPRRGECWCDDSCIDFDDCCPDFLSICKGIGNMDSSTVQPGNVDECDPDSPSLNCDVNAVCIDNSMNYICSCIHGYSGDGISCTDVESPNILCPANLTVYTACSKTYSTATLPDADFISDNSGVVSVTIHVDDSTFEVDDAVTLFLADSPYLVRYNATDESSNSAECETYIMVANVTDAAFCESTGNPPNCICLPDQAPDCTCSSGYCGHDCSQSSEGVECTGPAMPYPNCTDIDECDPGHSGPRCDADGSALQCPEVGNECLDEGVSSVSISWRLSTSLDPVGADISCTNVEDGTSVNTTGGVFGIGTHLVICSSLSGGSEDCLISFSVSAYPDLTVPAVGDQCTDPGVDTATVTWTEVYAMDAGEVTIDCTDSGDGVGVGLTGGVFGVGPHTITCRAVNAAGCETSRSITFNIMKGNLIPYGSDVGDRRLSDEPQLLRLPKKDKISRTIYPPNFFPYCNGLYEKIYFTDNGVIVLSNEQRLDKFAFPSSRGRFFRGTETMITPFWADVRGDAFTAAKNVFWQIYDKSDLDTNQEIMDIIRANVSASDFQANWALVITWSNVLARPNKPFSYETNTFQAVLATDGIHSFVIFNYDPCGMNWDFRFLNPNVILGFTCGASGKHVYVDVPEHSLYRPGDIVGNTGMRGRWIYQLDTLPDDFVNPRLSCHNWYDRQIPYPEFALYYPPFADTCPCSLVAANFDWRFTQVPSKNLPPALGSRFPAVCFVRLFQFPGTPGPQCCYNIFTCDLLYYVRSPRIASVFERYPVSPVYYTENLYQQWLEEEVRPRYYCCQRSALCHLYIEWRPLMTCWAYVPPAWVWFWGDPHIVTLDGLEYTFNGLGEYTLALIEDDDGQRVFELQGRTRQAVDTETGQLSQATVYSGFAALYTGEARIEIKLSDDAMDLVTTVNGTVVTPTAQGLLFETLQVMRVENPIKVSVMYSDHVTFTVGVNNSMADITVLLNQDFKGKTKGILGVWDDDPSNDALTRNGTLQTGSGADGELVERDYFEFGETWRISEEDSLFFYQSPNESYGSLNDPNFTPDFLQELIDKAPPGKYEEAKAVCGSSKTCLYDSLALNDTSIGMATLMLNEMNSINMAMSMNFPPNLTLVESIEVVVGQAFTLQLEAVDPDGDNVTYHLLQSVEGASISSDGLFTWTPANKSKVSIGFLATDGIANATLEPIVQLCGCENDGTCLFDQYVSGTNLVQDRFGVVLCECQPGWTGEFCEMDYDACADNPCFMDVACTDEAPPSYNSTCGPCPEGLEGDGKSCQDIDECELYINQTASNGGLGCDQNCENILMNYTCSCNLGYLLHEDGRRCIEAPSTVVPVSSAASTSTYQSETSTAEPPSTVKSMSTAASTTRSATSSADTPSTTSHRSTATSTVTSKTTSQGAPSTTAAMLNAAATTRLSDTSAAGAPSTTAAMPNAAATTRLSDTSAAGAPLTTAAMTNAASTTHLSDTSAAGIPSTTPRRTTSTSAVTSKTTTAVFPPEQPSATEKMTTAMSKAESTTERITTARGTSAEPTTTDCQPLICLNGGTFDAESCECVCPLTHSGATCSVENPCLSGNRCPGAQHYCLPDLNQDGFTCVCSVFDGFFPQDDGSCRKLPSKQIVLIAVLDFNQAYQNPSSAAFRRLAAVFERAIFMRLKENPSTNNVSSVHVPLMEEGSVVVRSVASFENGAPSDASLQQVMSSSPSLSDGNTVINFDQDAITVNDGEVGCVPTHCKNGGTCEASGNFPYVSFTCSCPASYTGERCEIEVQEPDGGGLSTVTIVLIIVGCIVLLTVVICMLVCLCLMMQSQQAKSLAYRQGRQQSRVPRESGSILDNYGDLSTESGDFSHMADFDDEGGRMSHLMHVMNRSPYLQQNLSGREEFVRPYMVTGMEGPYQYREDRPVNPAGRVVRNPMVN